MTDNLDQLRQVAEGATRGPWQRDDFHQVVRCPAQGIIYDASCDGVLEWMADTDA